MSERTKQVLAPVLAAALLGLLAAGCSIDGGGDKAGASSAPTVVRLAAAEDAEQPESKHARYFASRVSELSGGSLRVQIVYDAAGEENAGYETRLARMVREGEFELGWIGARAWDRSGVKNFQALQAPFLVSNHALLGRITTGPLASRMLAGLESHGFVGLALVPDRLRYPTGARHALASPEDFDGARVRVAPSRATDALIRALGATPVHLRGEALTAALADGEIDGSEVSLGTNTAGEGENFLTWNVILFPKALTLFAGRSAYERLDDDQRASISQAARQTAAHAAAHPLSESTLMRNFCGGGRAVAAVAASQNDLAALSRAARPVYAELERDSGTKALIAAIRELKAKTPAGGPAQAPEGCTHEAPISRDRKLSPSTLNGTYRWRLTRQGARAVGVVPDDEDIGSVVTMTLRDGGWQLGDDVHYSGTFEVRGNRVIFDWPSESYTITFSFKRHANGDLDLKPLLPMDRGDQFVWASAPWRRVGPPVRKTP